MTHFAYLCTILCCFGICWQTWWRGQNKSGRLLCWIVCGITGFKVKKKKNLKKLRVYGFYNSPLFTDCWTTLSRSSWRSSVLWRIWLPLSMPPTPSSSRSFLLDWRAALGTNMSHLVPSPPACWAAWCVWRASSPNVCHSLLNYKTETRLETLSD